MRRARRTLRRSPGSWRADAAVPAGRPVRVCRGPRVIQQMPRGARHARIVVVGVCMEADRIEPIFAINKSSTCSSSSATRRRSSPPRCTTGGGPDRGAPLITGTVGVEGVAARSTRWPTRPPRQDPRRTLARLRGDPVMIRGIHHTAISTPNLDRAWRFYRDLLGLRVAATSRGRSAPRWPTASPPARVVARAVMLQAGNAFVELFQYETPAPRRAIRAGRWRPRHHAPLPRRHRPRREYERLRAAGMTFHCPPQISAGCAQRTDRPRRQRHRTGRKCASRTTPIALRGP